MNEKDIIQYFISPHHPASVSQGIGDDCAVLNISTDHQLVTTTDTMVEDKHFVAQSPAYELGYKLMATNLSDIASMGARPKWATLNLTLAEVNLTWISQFAKGLLFCAQKHQVVLVGGDTTLGKQLTMSLQLSGEIPIDQANLRKNAQLGDIIYVTGKIGCAAHALKLLKQHSFQHSALSKQQITALYMPPSRVELALALRNLIHASIDISDGLLHELEILCQQSDCGAALQLDNIPFDHSIDIMSAITAGDDYELLFTADRKQEQKISGIADKYDCLISAIGEINSSCEIVLFQQQQQVPYPDISGYDHFVGNNE